MQLMHYMHQLKTVYCSKVCDTSYRGRVYRDPSCTYIYYIVFEPDILNIISNISHFYLKYIKYFIFKNITHTFHFFFHEARNSFTFIFIFKCAPWCVSVYIQIYISQKWPLCIKNLIILRTTNLIMI